MNLTHDDTTQDETVGSSTNTPLSLDFSEPDYRDHFELTAGTTFDNIDAFATRLALDQPSWLIRLSTGISGRAALESAVASMTDGDHPAIGNWKLVGRTSDSITFTEDMKVMRYQLTYRLVAPNRVTARTDVVQESRWFGPIYWALATPLHRRFLQRMLRNAGGANSSTAALPLDQ